MSTLGMGFVLFGIGLAISGLGIYCILLSGAGMHLS